MKNNTPSYLTKDFVKNVLQNGLKVSNIEIEDFTVSPGSPQGENYTSDIFRISVNYKLPQEGIKQISLILKNVQISTIMSPSFSLIDAVEAEMNMYTKLIPEIEKSLGITLAPKCFLADKEKKVIIMSDLNPLGYTIKNRLEGLDEVHCNLVMKKIAQLHAGSLHVAKINPEYRKILDKTLLKDFDMETDPFMKVFIFNFEQMINVVKKWSGFEEIVKKLEKIPSNMIEKSFENCKTKEGELSVINHGDFWVNNIMFKYDKDNKIPLDIAFVDLQMSSYGSLGNDLNYFLNSSPQLDVLKSKRTELLKIYYESFKSTLEQLKYSPIPSLEAICKEVSDREFYGLITLGGIFPLIAMDRSASQNNCIANMLDDPEKKCEAMFGSERVKETLKYGLKRLDELGVLDE